MNDLEHRVSLALLEIDELLKELEAFRGQLKGIDTIISQVKRARIAIEGIVKDATV